MKLQAKPRESDPVGKWRVLVRGLRASISASSTRLKAMATDRAATIATTIHASLAHKPSRANPASRQASSAPVSANGSANTECSNLIISSVRRRRVASDDKHYHFSGPDFRSGHYGSAWPRTFVFSPRSYVDRSSAVHLQTRSDHHGGDPSRAVANGTSRGTIGAAFSRLG